MTDKPWGTLLDDGTVIIKDRRLYVMDDDFSLMPGSLIGSWFHTFVDGVPLWQGVVVSEPRPGAYLCEIETLEEGATQVQRVFPLEILAGMSEPVIDPHIEWRFYDSEEEALYAWAKLAEHHDHDVKKEVD